MSYFRQAKKLVKENYCDRTDMLAMFLPRCWQNTLADTNDDILKPETFDHDNLFVMFRTSYFQRDIYLNIAIHVPTQC